MSVHTCPSRPCPICALGQIYPKRDFVYEDDLRRSQKQIAALEAQLAEERRVREASMWVLASLVAATHLLRNGGRKAAPSDKMFQQMLDDYEDAADRYRAALAAAAKLEEK